MEKYLDEKHGKGQEAERTMEVKQENPEVFKEKECILINQSQTQKFQKGELKKSVLQSLRDFQKRVQVKDTKNNVIERSEICKKKKTELSIENE